MNGKLIQFNCKKNYLKQEINEVDKYARIPQWLSKSKNRQHYVCIIAYFHFKG